MTTVAAAPSRTPRNQPAVPGVQHAGELLGSYLDGQGRRREIICRRGAHGSALVIDGLAGSLDDARLLAHLCSDEPAENARIVTALYLADEHSRRCRPLTAKDFQTAPLEAGETQPAITSGVAYGAPDPEVVDSLGRTYHLARAPIRMSIPELRWHRHPPRGERGCAEVVTVRAAIGGLESYEPVRAITAQALVAHRGDPCFSVAALDAELARVYASHVVLNRGLREAVVASVNERRVTMSEIAIRCGRLKRDTNGTESGETSWLARRIGMPWVSSDVLALIARDGLGISPHEVELG
jgi:hypothetical protein